MYVLTEWLFSTDNGLHCTKNELIEIPSYISRDVAQILTDGRHGKIPHNKRTFNSHPFIVTVEPQAQ